MCKKKDKTQNTDQNFVAPLNFDIFEVQLKFAFRKRSLTYRFSLSFEHALAI